MPAETNSVNTPKAALKDLAKNSGLRMKDLLVLAPQNDPFNCGGPEQIRQATWFAELWHRFIDGRAHIRKLFYPPAQEHRRATPQCGSRGNRVENQPSI